MSKLLLFLSGGFFFTGIVLQAIDPGVPATGNFHPWFLLMVPSFFLALISEA